MPYYPIRLAACTILAAICSSDVEAGSPIVEESKTVTTPDAVPLNLLRLRSSYVFESDFDRGHRASGDAWSNSIEFSRRIPLGISWSPAADGAWYLRLGAEYNRFDFGNSGNLPLPDTLQSFAATIAVEYLVGGETALLLETSPGFYFEEEVRGDAFDAPTKLAAAYRVNDRFILLGGVSYASLRSYPFLPLLGFIWNVSDQWTLRALVPEPRIIYRPSPTFAIWAGGELAGGSFRTDNDGGRPGRLRGATVSYSEFRAGAGVTIGNPDRTVFELGGGYAFNREFDYHRAGDAYNTAEGAPYAKLGIRAAF